MEKFNVFLLFKMVQNKSCVTLIHHKAKSLSRTAAFQVYVQ